MLAGDFERLDPVARLQRVVAVRFEQVIEQLHVQIVVFDDQHLLGALTAWTAIPIHHFKCHTAASKVAPTEGCDAAGYGAIHDNPSAILTDRGLTMW